MSSPELLSAAHVAGLAQQLVVMTAERDRLAHELDRLVHELERLAHERDRLAHERDEYRNRAEWLQKQLERLKDEAKTPREHVDPRQLQLVFEPFAQALLVSTAASAEPEPTPQPASPDASDASGKDNKKRKVTPHGRRVLPEHLPIETLVLTPSPLPEDAVQIGEEIS